MKPKSTDMTPTEIRIALIRSGKTQAQLAVEIGVSRTMIFKLIEGQTVSERVERGIAQAVGLEVERIWPSRYLNRVRRKRGRPKAVNY